MHTARSEVGALLSLTVGRQTHIQTSHLQSQVAMGAVKKDLSGQGRLTM